MTANVSAATSAAAATTRCRRPDVSGLSSACTSRGTSCQQRERGRRAGRHEEPPARAPVDRDRQQAADHRPDQVRDAGAGAPDAERGAAALRREARHRAGQRGRAHEPGADALHDAGEDQDLEVPCQRTDQRARGEHRQARRARPCATRSCRRARRRGTASARRRRSTRSGHRRAGASRRPAPPPPTAARR